MKKIILTIFSLLVFCIIFSSCSMNNNQANEVNIQLEYNNKTYLNTDNQGRIIKSYWLIDETYTGETENVKAIQSYNGSKSNITVKRLKNESLNMFLFDDDFMYCEENFNFPDYRKNAGIDKIIIIPNANTFPDEKNSITIDNKEDIRIILKTLVLASDFDNYKNNSASEQPQSNDSEIRIVYSDCPAVFYYGYISINQDNDFGLYCADVECANYLYTLDENTLNVLAKYLGE